MATEDSQGRRIATPAERHRISLLLEEHCERISGSIDEPGVCKYRGDMTDAKLAGLAGEQVSRNSVVHIRQHTFGNLQQEPAGPRDSRVSALKLEMQGLAADQAALEGRVKDILCRVVARQERLRAAFNSLADNLGVSHVMLDQVDLEQLAPSADDGASI